MSSAVELTRDMAWAAGIDAANRQMRDAGRSKWNASDHNVAAVTTNKLLLQVPVQRGGLMGLPAEMTADLGVSL